MLDKFRWWHYKTRFTGRNINFYNRFGVYYPDGTETQQIGIIPDIEVMPTIKGIREGRDELLEKAIAYLLK
jgi:C-terminal processing protease CtpA/Prc